MRASLDAPIIVADSSGLVSLVTLSDANHAKATELAKLLGSTQASILIPEGIFTETLNVLAKKSGHETASRTAQELLASETFVIHQTGPEIRIAALDKLVQQTESVSFADCVVMATADYFGSDEIFGFDSVFRKNGYRLPGPDR